MNAWTIELHVLRQAGWITERSAKHNAFQLYPSPTNSTVTITLERAAMKGDIRVLDARRVLVHQQCSNGVHTTIDVGGLPAGIYHVQYIDAYAVHMGRFVKE